MTAKEKLNEVQRLFKRQKEHDKEFEQDPCRPGHSIHWHLKALQLLDEIMSEIEWV